MEKILIVHSMKAEQEMIRRRIHLCITVGVAALLMNLLFTPCER